MRQSAGVRGLLVKTGPGKLSAQLRCAYAFALDQGYDGIVTIDGNDKDDPEAIPRFIEALESGVDFVQASRFIAGGHGREHAALREWAIRWIHAPLLSAFSGFRWTDTTQGFRAYSRRMLPIRGSRSSASVFASYELLAYLSYRAPRLGFAASSCRRSGATRQRPCADEDRRPARQSRAPADTRSRMPRSSLQTLPQRQVSDSGLL